MRILEFQNLEREDVQIFYIRKYSAKALIEFPIKQEIVNINFSIEMNSFCHKEVSLQILDKIDYPLLPVKKSLLDFINNLENEGRLPC